MTIQIEKTSNLESTDRTEELASVVKRLGNPVSTILLDGTSLIFRIPQVDGIIGYQLIKNCAVVIGDPICLPENVTELTQAFHHYCQEHNLRIIYFLASDSFSHWAIHNGCHTLIQVGEELLLDPTKFKKRQKLRWKINQSILADVVINEYMNYDHLFEAQMKNTVDAWLKTRNGPQIHLGDLNFFVTGVDKRIFYAMQNNKIVGLLKISRIDRYEGWVVNSYLATPDAPIGTTEHLMSVVFDTLAKENCHYLCLGAISGSKLGEIVGLNIFSKFIAHLIFKFSKWFFKLDARNVYLSKYKPHLAPTYFLFSGKLTLMELMAIKQILNVKLCLQ